MSWTQVEVRELKEGRYILIEDEPCKIIHIQMSKPGKHGEAKARLDAVGLFDDKKRSIVHPVTHKVLVPIIDKRQAQVLSIQGSEVQLMDMTTYEVFTLHIDDEIKDLIQPQKEIQYMDAMGRKKIIRT